jgi:FAD/FMN-containing dehydrogenase
VLIELSDLEDEARARDALEELLEAAFEQGDLVDAAIADSLAQTRSFWALREGISEAQGAIGKTIKHDIAVPVSRVPAFLADADAAIVARWPDIRFVTFGHLGDGNIHYNFSPPKGGDQQAFLAEQEAINRVTHDIVARHGGTLSAEHGLGQLRHHEAARYRSPVETALMRTVKQALDPLGLMNPGKLLP